MKRVLWYLHHYWQFSAAIVAAIIAGILTIFDINTAAHWVLGVVSLALMMPLIWGMWQDFRDGAWGLDVLALTAIVASVALGQYWAAIVVAIMLTGGESLEDWAGHRARSELDALLKRAPQTAHVLKAGKLVEVKASQVKERDKLVIKPGEVVPVDAEIIEGQASFDESSLTGESLPQLKKAGQQILSGSVNLDGSVTVRAAATSAESQYQQIIKLVRAAQKHQAKFVRLADHYAVPFTVLAYAIAVGVWVISGDAIRFLEVIVVATPCPLLLAAPIAFISGMSRASKYGVIVKGGPALEKLASLKTMAFDKTGTLTLGRPKVSSVKAYSGFNSEQVLSLAASLEQNSNHILAQAITTAADKKKLKYKKAKHVSEAAGHGLKAQLDGKTILVGRLDFLKDRGVQLPAKLGQPSQTATYVAAENKLAGVVHFADEIRPESKHTLNLLRKFGINNFLMVTGDHKSAAAAVAKSLKIADFTAEALPSDKLRAVEKVSQRPVGFVGDGVNDAPVLATADVGIALGARGSTAASESADVVVMQDDLAQVARAVGVAKKAVSIAKQSILVGIIISIGLMIIYATGKFSPLSGAILQEVVDVIVIFNALRAHNIKVSVS